MSRCRCILSAEWGAQGASHMKKPVRQSFSVGRNPLLELCPFCGEPGEIYCVPGDTGCRVRCSNSHCTFKPDSKVSFSSEDRAIKAWNTHKGGLNAKGDVRSVAKALLEETDDLFI